ncbi:serine hydrolase [Streptomyces sp. NPDC059076]|uniref:serine hydrolase n=1 Tax=unclassified Streptomyces TaxID=2593676 RepID=UPI0036838091
MTVRISVALPGRSYGDEHDYPCASLVKVAILAALLQRRDGLGAREEEWARAMIVRSDNEAATELWHVLGGAPGLSAATAGLGLRQTLAQPAWGLTRTTAPDQLRLLETVFDGGYPLLTTLMGQVVEGQRWGVSAAGGPCALKNGWLPVRPSGLWAVHSMGRVGGRLIAVLSDGHPTLAAGVSRVEAAVREAVRAP